MDPFSDGDDDSNEPEEFDPSSLGPEVPTVDTPSADGPEIDADVDEVLLRTFWGSVIALNVAMAAVPLGLMLIYFRGDWELGGLAIAVGCVAGVAAARFYYIFRTDRTGGGGPP
ncbi:DUF7322 domain-containing protein [Natronomonas marina]|uniref:DUF7322 domain-containing protein n=1 Tax=Natronomonas marina TaxID=2961939 RepID=UPI0020CA08DF|nr:hypothetical protein [Natronomonas marina]